MLFNSYAFWFFFAIVSVLYWRLSHSWQNWLLLIASYVFYGAWDWRFLSLIWISTAVDFVAGIQIFAHASERRKRAYLLLSLVANLGILSLFKYYGFFSGELNHLLNLIGLPSLAPSVQFVLPVGISFYTFQTMSYTIDVYRGELEPERNLRDFALYVSFFPQLVAGPIERSTRLLPQIISPRSVSYDQIQEGVGLITMGLFQKIVVADNMASIVNTIFQSDTATVGAGEVFLGVYAFAFQIYGDFAGYSSIARGVAKFFGIELMLNFRRPYFAVSPSDFWTRWHISLSSWLRDYLYFPLGGSRHGIRKTYRNLMLTMTLGGFWHGAAWTFLAWGFYHGAILSAYKYIEAAMNVRLKDALERSFIRRPGRLALILINFHLVCVGWLFFRADSIQQAFQFISAVFTNWRMSEFAVGGFALMSFYVVPLIVYELWVETYQPGEQANFAKAPSLYRGLCYAYCITMIFLFPPPVNHEFVYFQF